MKMTLIFKATVIVMVLFNGSSHSPYVVADLKVLVKKARCHECGSKISLEPPLDQYQGIGAHLKLLCGSSKSTSANFYRIQKQR